MAHSKTKLKSYRLLKSEAKVGSSIESLYIFDTEDGEMLGYVGGVADKMILGQGFEGEIEYWDLGRIYTRERYPELYIDERGIMSVSLISKESQELNDSMVASIYG